MKKTLADMVRSLGLMAVIVAAVVFIGARYLVFPGSSDQMPAADYTGVLQGFQDKTSIAPLRPTALPTSWRANAARLLYPTTTSVQMHIGWALPHSRYAGLDEATGSSDAAITAVLGDVGRRVIGEVSIGGATWQRRMSSLGEQALTRERDGVTAVITGNATDAELAQLAASLR